MSELELQLASLRDAVDYPPTPDLATAVERSLRTPAVGPSRLRALAFAVVIVVAVAAGVLALSPGARSALLELFQLEGATVVRVDSLPEVELITFDLGERVSREEAERLVGFRLLDLGPSPGAIYVRNGRVASLVYGPPDRPRLVLSQFRGAVWEGFLKKAVGSGTTIERVTVGGEPGLFVSGDEHYVMFVDGTGRITDERTALAGNTLLWNRGPLLLRLEADVPRDEALALAETVR